MQAPDENLCAPGDVGTEEQHTSGPSKAPLSVAKEVATHSGLLTPAPAKATETSQTTPLSNFLSADGYAQPTKRPAHLPMCFMLQCTSLSWNAFCRSAPCTAHSNGSSGIVLSPAMQGMLLSTGGQSSPACTSCRDLQPCLLQCRANQCPALCRHDQGMRRRLGRISSCARYAHP